MDLVAANLSRIATQYAAANEIAISWIAIQLLLYLSVVIYNSNCTLPIRVNDLYQWGVQEASWGNWSL